MCWWWRLKVKRALSQTVSDSAWCKRGSEGARRPGLALELSQFRTVEWTWKYLTIIRIYNTYSIGWLNVQDCFCIILLQNNLAKLRVRTLPFEGHKLFWNVETRKWICCRIYVPTQKSAQKCNISLSLHFERSWKILKNLFDIGLLFIVESPTVPFVVEKRIW